MNCVCTRPVPIRDNLNSCPRVTSALWLDKQPSPSETPANRATLKTLDEFVRSGTNMRLATMNGQTRVAGSLWTTCMKRFQRLKRMNWMEKQDNVYTLHGVQKKTFQTSVCANTQMAPPKISSHPSPIDIDSSQPAPPLRLGHPEDSEYWIQMSSLESLLRGPRSHLRIMSKRGRSI